MYKIFDIHTHIYPEAIAQKAVTNLNHFYDFVCEGKGTLSDITESSGLAEVGGCLLLGVATNEKQVEHVNEYLADACMTYTTDAFRMLAFACVHQDTPDMPALADHIKKMGLRGFKIHPDIQRVNIDDERLYPLYEAIEGRMPIAFHLGDDREEYQFSAVERLLRIKKRFPRLEVLAAHLGGYRTWEKSYLLAELEHVWFDASSALWAMSPKRATSLVHELGTDRVMFGTDYPVAYVNSELERFLLLDLDEQERRAILWDNAARFLGL
ncbi:MAG: amidohydrolase family protein [Clostridia bacterium]|nr:amidohydrolase family protein [Clostridia bacterium]MBO5305971.1 amidohydrolase family protein [Clostridia bacterium]